MFASDLPERRGQPFLLPWPSRGNIGGVRPFQNLAEWRDFITDLSLSHPVPRVVDAKFSRALRLFYLGWIDVDLIKAGELAGLVALELSLRDRYGKKTLAHLLKHMCDVDGLCDASIPMVQKYGASAIGRIDGSTKPTLSQLRNALAHGDPFDGAPISGLLELIRDLIDYAYRKWP